MFLENMKEDIEKDKFIENLNVNLKMEYMMLQTLMLISSVNAVKTFIKNNYLIKVKWIWKHYYKYNNLKRIYNLMIMNNSISNIKIIKDTLETM